MSERLGWRRRDIVLAVQVRGAIDRSPAGTVAFCQVEGDDHGGLAVVQVIQQL